MHFEDAADLPRSEGKPWNWMPRSDGSDAVVVLSAPAGEQVPMRRIILGLEGPQWRISHANGDPLDCRRANLVVRSVSEQLGYSNRPAVHVAVQGVCWIERLGGWQARIQKEGGRRLGLFDSEFAAALAYDEAARELFGEHARLNFPGAGEAGTLRRAEQGDTLGTGGLRAADRSDCGQANYVVPV